MQKPCGAGPLRSPGTANDVAKRGAAHGRRLAGLRAGIGVTPMINFARALGGKVPLGVPLRRPMMSWWSTRCEPCQVALAVHFDKSAKAHALKATRLVTLRAEDPSHVAAALDDIGRRVPDLKPITDAAKTYLHEEFLARAATV